MKKVLAAWMSILFVAAATQARAEVTVAHRLSGYGCMALNLNEQQMMDPSINVEIRSEPTASSAPIGTASAIVIVAMPLKIRNGFAEVLHLNGKLGWISTTYLKPWHAADGSNSVCTPSVMSNGRIGTSIH